MFCPACGSRNQDENESCAACHAVLPRVSRPAPAPVEPPSILRRPAPLAPPSLETLPKAPVRAPKPFPPQPAPFTDAPAPVPFPSLPPAAASPTSGVDGPASTSLEARAQEARAQEARAQEARAQEARAQEAHAQEARAQEARAQEARAQEARAQEVETTTATGQEARAQEVRPSKRAIINDETPSFGVPDERRKDPSGDVLSMMSINDTAPPSPFDDTDVTAPEMMAFDDDDQSALTPPMASSSLPTLSPLAAPSMLRYAAAAVVDAAMAVLPATFVALAVGPSVAGMPLIEQLVRALILTPSSSIAFVVAVVAISAVHHGTLVAKRGVTLGGMIAGIAVRSTSGRPLPLPRALLRGTTTAVSALLFGAGPLYAFWLDDKRRNPVDVLFRTVLVDGKQR